MRSLLAIVLTFTLSGLLSAYTLPQALAASAAEATPAITVTLACAGDPERTRITNRSRRPVTITRIGSLYAPRSNEPFTVNKTVLAGNSVVFQTGRAATHNVLTRQYIYSDGARLPEGARVVTSAGVFRGKCWGNVTDAQAQAEITNDQTCEVTLTGTITTDGSGMVTYHWEVQTEGNVVASLPERTLEFSKADTLDVEPETYFAEGYSSYEASVVVTSPNTYYASAESFYCGSG